MTGDHGKSDVPQRAGKTVFFSRDKGEDINLKLKTSMFLLIEKDEHNFVLGRHSQLRQCQLIPSKQRECPSMTAFLSSLPAKLLSMFQGPLNYALLLKLMLTLQAESVSSFSVPPWHM
jgi:hypothetical protein